MHSRATLPRLHIHAKLLVAFVLVLLPVLGLLIAGFLSDLRRTQAYILDAQAMTAQSVAVQVGEVFDGAVGLGWAVAQDPRLVTLDSRVLDSHLRKVVERSPLYESIGIYDARGHQRGWGGKSGLADPGRDIHDRQFFQQVMASNAPIISNVHELERTHRAGLVASVPIRDARGQPIGVVTIQLRAEQLADRFLDARSQQRQVLLLIDPSRRLAFHTGAAYLPYRQSGAYLRFDAIQKVLNGIPARLARFTSPFLEDEHLGAFAPVPKYPWAVGVSVERDLALAPVYEQMHLRLTVFAGILLLSLLLALGLTRFYARPVRQLQAAAQALGQGDREARVHIETGDELEELGKAFNTMAAEVARRETEVNALHKEAERQALELSAIIASVPEAILVANPEGRLVGTNPAGFRLLGIKSHSGFDEVPFSERLRRHDIRHPDGRPMEQKDLPIIRALRGESFTDAEMLFRRPDGRQILLSINGAPVRDASGQIILGELVIRDITRHRQEEEALRRSEESLAQAQRIAHLGNWDWDLVSHQFHGSNEVYRILGLAPQARTLSREKLLAFVPPQDRQGLEKALEAARVRLEPFSLDHRILRPDGTERIVHHEVEVHPDAEGHPVRILGTVQDITEHKQVEDELARLLDQELALARVGQALVSEVELERIAEVVIEQCRHSLHADAVGVWLAEPERRELTLLAAHHIPEDENLRHLSFDAPELTAQAARTELIQVVEDLQAEEGPPRAPCRWTEEGLRGVAAFPLRSRGHLVGVMTYGTHTPRTFSARELEFHSTLGQLFAVAIEKARLFQQVRETLRLREEFMAAAAHELKTPVTTIQTWADILLDKEALSPRQSKGLTAISRNTRRITRLVEHLFATVRMAPSEPKLERKPFDLHALVRERVEKAARNTENPIHIEASGPLIVHADRYLMGDVVSHLLENALSYSSPGGVIQLKAWRKGDDAVVSVHDQGPGIPPERQPHIFEPLYEPLPPGDPGYTGVVGLGLHLSRQIIEAHGGHIWLVSTPGAGSTFSFNLPLAEASSEAALPMADSAPELLLPG